MMDGPTESGAFGYSEYFRIAEKRAVGIRKSLRRLQPEGSAWGVMDNALKIADTIESLAHWGQKVDAEEAAEVAGSIEILIDMLQAELDQI
jgi:hypothetical protein